MPKGYVIVTGTIHDPEGMKAYNRLASRTISEGGGKVLVVDTKPELAWQPNRRPRVRVGRRRAGLVRVSGIPEGGEAAAGGGRLQRSDPLGLRGLARQRAFSSKTA